MRLNDHPYITIYLVGCLAVLMLIIAKASIFSLVDWVTKANILRKNLKKLEMWIADTNVYPVQQKFYLPGGDFRLVTYTNVKVNTGLRDSDLALKLPKDVKRVTPQK